MPRSLDSIFSIIYTKNFEILQDLASCFFLIFTSLSSTVKASDPEFECVAENVLETWQKDNHTFKKTEYTMKLDVNDRTFYSSGNTKKSAKTAAATEAWNVIRIGTM